MAVEYEERSEREERAEQSDQREARADHPRVRPRAPRAAATPDTPRIAGPEETVQTRAVKVKAGVPVGNSAIHEGAVRYVRENGIAKDIPDSPYVQNDVPLQTRIAQEYAKAVHAPQDPKVAKAYQALTEETGRQWDFASRPEAQGGLGMTFEPWLKEGQPYQNSAEMRKDVANRHLYFFQGGEMPADHPMRVIDPATGFSHNDKFRAVHDLFGHSAMGFDFGTRGEENAWREHAKMFSPAARKALATETRGQNSWVNYGSHGESNRANPGQTTYAEQKATLLPDWAIRSETGGGAPALPKKGKGKGKEAKAEEKPHRTLEEMLADKRTINILDPKTLAANPQVLAEIKQQGYNSLDEVRQDLLNRQRLSPETLDRLANVPADVKQALVEPGRPAARPGALTRLPTGSLPNVDLLNDPSLAPHLKLTEGGLVVSPTAPTVRVGPHTVRSPIAALKDNPLVPGKYEHSPKAEQFSDWARENETRLALGQVAPEALAVSFLSTLASINRGATPWTSIFGRKPVKTDRQGKVTRWAYQDEPVMNPGYLQAMQPDVDNFTGPTNPKESDLVRGPEIRPEGLMSLAVGDTSNPTLMRFLSALSRPGAFRTPESRKQALIEGARYLIGGEDSPTPGLLQRMGYRTNHDREKITGEPYETPGGNLVPFKGPIGETFPRILDTMGQWARGEGDFQGLGRDEANRTLFQKMMEVGLSGVRATKLPFFLGMSVNPDFGTLDKRMLHDVFGLSDDMMGDKSGSLTPDERFYLLNRIYDSVKNAKSTYEAQWRVWQYLTGEKTSYDVLMRVFDRINDYFHRAGEKTAANPGTYLEDHLPALSAQEPAFKAVRGDTSPTVAHIGVTMPDIQGLESGTSGETMSTLLPDLVQELRRSGVNLVGAKAGEDAAEQVKRLLSVGQGGWGDPRSGIPFNEKNLWLHVQGPKSAVEYLGAVLGRLHGERAVTVAHDNPNGPHNIAEWDLPKLTPKLATQLGERFSRDIPEGWSFGWPQGAGKLLIYRDNLDDGKFRTAMARVQEALNVLRLEAALPSLRKGEVKTIERDAYPTYLYGGPAGYRLQR